MFMLQLKKEKVVVDKVIFKPQPIEYYVATIVPMTPLEVVVSTSTQSDDEVDAGSLISSLSKFFEKKKSIKYLEKILASVLDRLPKIVTTIVSTFDVQQRETILTKAFDSDLTTLTNVAMVQAQTKHDVGLLDIFCTNVRNDIESFNV